MIVREWLQQARERLSGFPSAEVDARLLLEHLMGKPLNTSDVVDVEAANVLLERRLAHEPVQYITGFAPFRYLELEVGPGVLIPRPETEVLVDLAKGEIGQQSLSVVDLGSGSGAIAISIATETPARVTAVEKEDDAYFWLSRNVKKLAPQVECLHSDVAELDMRNVDLVVANPPYVPDAQALPSDVAGFEPRAALFGGQDGTVVPEVFMQTAARILRNGGLMIMEHAESHQDRMVELAGRYFDDVKRHQDLLSRPRFISGRLR